MNPLDHDAEQYVCTVLHLYQQLPETPALPSSRDRLQAHQLQQRRLPLRLIETAFLLACPFVLAAIRHQTLSAQSRGQGPRSEHEVDQGFLAVISARMTRK